MKDMIFNFSAPTVVEKPKKVRNPKIKYIEGCVHINIEGDYYIVLEDNRKLEFSDESYDCTKTDLIYAKSLNKGHRVSILRETPYKSKLNKNMYTPFGVGCIVDGTITEDNKFQFNEIISPWVNDKSKEALSFFKDNYKTIINNVKSKLKNDVY